MQLISWILFFLISISLIIPLRIAWWKKIFLMGILLIATQKYFIYQLLGAGEMFFSPELSYWMIFLFSFLFSVVFLLFFFVLLNSIIWLIFFFLKRKYPREKMAFVVFVFALILAAYGTYNAEKQPIVKVHHVYLPKLATELDGFKIVLLADIHLSATNQENFATKLVEQTNALNPDIVVLNGDLIDGRVENRQKDILPLKTLKSKYGVWMCLGNHEYYSGSEKWMILFPQLGINVLRNQHHVFDLGKGKIVLAGVDDLVGVKFGAMGDNLEKALENSPKEYPIILLSHQVKTAQEHAKLGADLQLSGHTHGGMILGLDRLIAFFNQGYVRGWYQVGNMQLFVSPGTSLWNGFPLRLGVISEISEIILHSKK